MNYIYDIPTSVVNLCCLSGKIDCLHLFPDCSHLCCITAMCQTSLMTASYYQSQSQGRTTVFDNYRPIANSVFFLYMNHIKPSVWVLNRAFTDVYWSYQLHLHDSPVYACFLYASKVDNTILFEKLLDRNLPVSPVVKLLLISYIQQMMRVKWSGTCFKSFCISIMVYIYRVEFQFTRHAAAFCRCCLTCR